MSQQKPKRLCAGADVLPSVGTPAEWLHQTFFRCPITGDRHRILNVRGAEAGLSCLEITTIGPRRAGEQRTAWRHRIYTQEADPKEAKAKRREARQAKQRPVVDTAVDRRCLKRGEPCGHPGCLSHVSHPCEGCGRIAGGSPANTEGK